MSANSFRKFAAPLVMIALIGAPAVAQAAKPDLGKKACAQEARKLCPAEMKSFSRKKVEACMIAKIEQTSATCHSAMLRIKAERGIVDKR
ncbi:hypothetical protein GGQ88_002075 [Novosphingobium hassiacum]|uniref:Cysteine rich repeat-containing protein n=1 Tax=Novosphingobium hassiacum TaxID=173676 RepID=A0A7W6EW25_9SPHN|nr:hypothetical protein [Novosphingobium hassiacum]